MGNVTIKLVGVSGSGKMLYRTIRQQTCGNLHSQVCSVGGSVSWDCKQTNDSVEENNGEMSKSVAKLKYSYSETAEHYKKLFK